MKNIHLLIIDPQNDFCHKSGSLYVNGADDDMARLSEFIRKNKKYISGITISFDTHNPFNVSFPVFWVDSSNNHPAPFTIINEDDILSGKYKASVNEYENIGLEYVRELKNNGRYQLCVWPPHCTAGSWGASMFEELFMVVDDYNKTKLGCVDYIFKGLYPFSEQYSVLKADAGNFKQDKAVYDKLKNIVLNSDIILISGEALSHCVANTIYDISSDITGSDLSKFILLKDTSSSVSGFENLSDNFINYAVDKGMKIMDTKSFEVIINE